jgi:uncharacterized SAM-binding protein YcdF (DUF218 family)
MYEVAKLAGYLLSPLTLVMMLGLVAFVCLAFGRRAMAAGLASVAFIGLWIASMPVTAQALTAALERDHPALTVAETPVADAIVVLGGAVAGRHPPRRPSLGLHDASSRIWHAADLYRAGKAKWIVVAAGGERESEREQVEAEGIAEMLTTLGVPASAIHLDRDSRNTRENAANTRAIVQRLGAKRVLLVTSAQHMERASRTFAKVWANSNVLLISTPADVQIVETYYSADMWIPSPYSLLKVTKALREYAGTVALAII